MEITNNTESIPTKESKNNNPNKIAQTKIPEETSKRITSLRFLLAMFVVFIHNNYTKENISSLVANPIFSPNTFTELLQFIISEGICNCAVPLFYVFAAYLQAKKADSYKILIKKRVRTLALPYILWLGIYLIFSYVLRPVISSLLSSSPITSNMEILNWNIKDWILQLFGYGQYLGFDVPYNIPLIASQFWFVRDLMILVLISPVLVYLIKRFPIGTFIFINVLHFSGIQIHFVIDYALYFYTLGLFWGIYDFDLFKKIDKISWVEIITLFVLALVGEKCLSSEKQALLNKIRIILSGILFLKLSALIIKNEKVFSMSKYFAAFSFFLYAIHMPVLLTLLQKIWIRILPMKNPFFCLFEYFGVTIIVILVGTAFGIALKKVCPKFFALLTGGR